MKRLILTYFLTAFALSFGASQTHAQIVRRACPSGACPYSATYRVANYQRVYAPYSYQYAQTQRVYAPTVAPCQSVQTVEPCAPIETVAPCDPVQTVEPCDPVQTVAPCQTQADQREADYLPERKLGMNAPSAPCAPVSTVCESCERGEYLPTDDGNICVGGTCPIRTAVRATANTTKNAVQTVAATTRFLLAANRIRAQYGLAALQSDATLDAGCETQARICQSRGALIHGGGNAEILAYNWSGFDAALVQWLDSPSHRALLLAPNFRTAGVAVVRGADGRVWCAMRFR